MRLRGNGPCAFTCCCRWFRTDTDKGIIAVGNTICCSFLQFCRYRGRGIGCANTSGDIITTKDGTDDDIMMVGTDVDEGMATYIGLSCTAIDTTSYINNRLFDRLGLHPQHCAYKRYQEQHPHAVLYKIAIWSFHYHSQNLLFCFNRRNIIIPIRFRQYI